MNRRMLNLRAALITTFAVAFTMTGYSSDMVEDLLRQYESVQTVSCMVRRDTQSGDQKGRVLSRVFFARQDKLHVETISPFKRRIISDGETFYDVPEGAPKGYSEKVTNLNEARLNQLRKVPGTAMDHLFRLKDLQAIPLPGNEEFPVRQGFQTSDQYVVLNLDDQNRLSRIEFFNESGDETARATYDYSEFVETEGAHIPTLHIGRVQQTGGEFSEETRIENLKVNGTIPPALFNPAGYFKKITFTENYQEVFGL